MVSHVDRAKRALVTLLNRLAVLYKLVLGVTRDSTDTEVRGAYKKLSRRCHPDRRGGSNEHQKALNLAHESWQEAKQAAEDSKKKKSQPKDNTPADTVVLPSWRQNRLLKEFRFRSAAVLLTYQKFSEPDVWKRFLKFVRSQLFQWKAQYWCATLETNSDDTFHLHLALQFYSAADRTVQAFTFEGVAPNARANDLLGEGWCGKKWQESVDRAFFYVWANKVGTVVDQSSGLCVEGNRMPAWTSASNTYAVKGAWLDKPLRAYKLSLTV